MNNIFNKIVLVAAAALLLWSCKKDEERAVITSGVAPALTASKTALVLEQDKANDTAIVFNWTAVDYGFKDAINYVLQISKAGTSFASATTTEMAVTKSSLRQAYTTKAINMELNKILKAGEATPVEIRLKSGVGNIFSNTIAMTVTAYRELIVYAWPQAINVAGNFQNWTPGTAPQIVSMANDGNYTGIIEFNNPSPEFKLVKGNDWPMGDYGSSGNGVLTNGGDSLKLPSAGTYLITANTNDMKWTSYKIEKWGLIGDAIAGTGWDSDVDLTYDAAAKTWSVTLNLIGGKAIKFRANDDWTVNIGDRGADGKPEVGGDNITVQESGNYTVTLDVSTGGNWVYTLKKN